MKSDRYIQFGSPDSEESFSRLPLIKLLIGLIVISIGMLLPFLMNSTNAMAVLSFSGITGVLIGTIWVTRSLPVKHFLCGGLIATFFFRFEINLFPVITEYGAAWGLNISLQVILLTMLCGAYFIARQTGELKVFHLPNFYLFSCFGLFICASLSVVYGKEKWLGICGLWMLGSFFLLAWILVAHFSNKQRLQLVLIVIAFGLAINGFLSLLQYKMGNISALRIIGGVPEEWQQSIDEGEIPRAAGLIQSANSFAWLLVSLIPFSVAQLLIRGTELRLKEKILHIAAILLGGAGLILSFARGSWGSFAISIPITIALCWWVLPLEQKKSLLVKLIGVAILLGVMIIPFSGLIVTRLTEDDRGSAESRLTMAQVASKMIRDNPFFGVGVNSYESEMRRYDDTSNFISDWFPYPVHNIYLHICGETGIPGLLLMLALIGYFFRHSWHLLHRSAPFYQALVIGLIAGMTAFLLTGTKEPSALGSSTFRIFFLLFGLLFATERASEAERQDEAEHEI